MRSIGQNAPLSHHVGRYGLGDRDKSLYESTTSINRWRMIGVIVAATRATQRLVIGVGGDGAFGNRLGT
jgi:hypothetical protein